MWSFQLQLQQHDPNSKMKYTPIKGNYYVIKYTIYYTQLVKSYWNLTESFYHNT
jgi:hypothetical protein